MHAAKPSVTGHANARLSNRLLGSFLTARSVSGLQIYTKMALKRLATEHRLNVCGERQKVVILQRICNLGPCMAIYKRCY